MVTKQDVWAAQQERDALREQLAKSAAQAREAAQEAKTHRQDVDALRKALRRAEGTAEALEARNADLSAEIDRLKAAPPRVTRVEVPVKVEGDKWKVEKARADGLGEELAAAKAELTHAKREAAKAQKAADVARAQIARLEDENRKRAAKPAVERVIEKRVVDRSGVEAAKAELAEVRKELAAARRTIKKLEQVERPAPKTITVCEREPEDIATIARLEQELAECRSSQAPGR